MTKCTQRNFIKILLNFNGDLENFSLESCVLPQQKRSWKNEEGPSPSDHKGQVEVRRQTIFLGLKTRLLFLYFNSICDILIHRHLHYWYTVLCEPKELQNSSNAGTFPNTHALLPRGRNELCVCISCRLAVFAIPNTCVFATVIQARGYFSATFHQNRSWLLQMSTNHGRTRAFFHADCRENFV